MVRVSFFFLRREGGGGKGAEKNKEKEILVRKRGRFGYKDTKILGGRFRPRGQIAVSAGTKERMIPGVHQVRSQRVTTCS